KELPADRTYRRVQAQLLADAASDGGEVKDCYRRLVAVCDRLAEVLEKGGPPLRDLVRAFDCPARCADAIAAALVVDVDARQELLDSLDPVNRLERTLGHVSRYLCELAPCDTAVN